MREEKRFIISGVCWDSELEIQLFLTPNIGNIPEEADLLFFDKNSKKNLNPLTDAQIDQK